MGEKVLRRRLEGSIVLRAHVTFFETRPDGDLLREHLSPATGFRLLRHQVSGAYLIESDDPGFATWAFSILETKKTPHLKSIKSILKSEEKAGRLEWGTYFPSDISDAIWLSEIFQTRVMIAYFDDDGGDMATVAHCGRLERACISGLPIDKDGDECYEIEMLDPEVATYRTVQREFWYDIFGREFKRIFGSDAPDLTDETFLEFEEVDRAEAGTRKRAPTKSIVFLFIIIIMAALFAKFQSPPSQPQNTQVEDTPKTIEDVCSGDLGSEMQHICDEFQRLNKKHQPKDPK